MNTFRCNTSSARMLTLKTVALAAAISASSVAMAAENYNQRYAPGIGGSDMSTPVQPGLYGQVAMLAYHASKLKGNDGGDMYRETPIPVAAITAVNAGLGGVLGATVGATGSIPARYKTDLNVDIETILPRITFISATKFLGGNVGFTAMLPLMRQKITPTASNVSLPTAAAALSPLGAGAGAAAAGLTAALAPSVIAGVADKDSTYAGIGDLEVAPLVHWEIGDHQTVSAAATVILPTGEFKADRKANSGFGNFYTFRPSVQYAFIGDGWDLSGRMVLSFNTRNKDSDYRTGNILNIDWAAMKFVSEDVRVGLQGYMVKQFTKDSSGDATEAANIALAGGNKMQVYAAGPAVAWLKNGGEFLLEGKFLQEFSAKNRTEGQTFWLTLSKPL
ncbi:MAG: transporter [Burkholderiales bacterium]|nr:transporter [Burkholderiales bacterium]